MTVTNEISVCSRIILLALLGALSFACPEKIAAETLAGFVRDASGNPVSDVTVWLCAPQDGKPKLFYFDKGKPTGTNLAPLEHETPKFVTGPEGAFQFEHSADPYILAATRDDFVVFFPSNKIKGDGVLEFQPATVEGVWAPRGVPKNLTTIFARHMELEIFREKASLAVAVAANSETMTDSEGRFTFNNVQGSLMILSDDPPESLGSAPGVIARVRLNPGEKVEINLGGKGRPVTGQLELDEEMMKRVAWKQSKIQIQSDVKALEGESPEVYRARVLAHAYIPEATMKDDGSIRIENVAAGPWRITANLEGFTSDFGRAQLRFEVPEIPGGNSNEPLDIGLIPIERSLGVGDAAPPLKGVTLDGQAFDLETHRGKYVLVDFWATWCGPCIGEVPHLEKVWEEFGGHENFAMISVSIDQKIETVQEYAEKHPEAWTQVWVGSSRSADSRPTLTAWSAQAIPAIYLVAPDGTIAGAGLRGGIMISTVRAKMKGQ